MPALLKPNHKPIQQYYAGLAEYAGQQVEHEGALETAFSRLLADTARPHRWTLMPKLPMKAGSKNIMPDGTLRDEFNLHRGYWEAKDAHDDLDAEIRKKIAKGYPLTEPDIEGFEEAVAEFKLRVPELAQGLAEKIKTAHRDNPRFQTAFDSFFTLCQQALNPNIRQDAVDEMLVQHLLTERLIRRIFDNEDFTRRNVIAAEVEKVIDGDYLICLSSPCN